MTIIKPLTNGLNTPFVRGFVLFYCHKEIDI
nr:MAG TPA: hypothetical protein [Caudoviricetes sp.]